MKKLRLEVNLQNEQQKAVDFFNRYNKESEANQEAIKKKY